MEERKIVAFHLRHLSKHKTYIYENASVQQIEWSEIMITDKISVHKYVRMHKVEKFKLTLAVHAALSLSSAIESFSIRTKQTLRSIDRLWKLKTSQNKAPKIGTRLNKSIPFWIVFFFFEDVCCSDFSISFEVSFAGWNPCYSNSIQKLFHIRWILYLCTKKEWTESIVFTAYLFRNKIGSLGKKCANKERHHSYYHETWEA